MTSFASLGFYLICLLAALRVYVEHSTLKRFYAECSIGVRFPAGAGSLSLAPVRAAKSEMRQNGGYGDLQKNRIMTNWQPGSDVSSAES